MLEILLLWFLWTRLARIVEPKGYRGLGFGLLLISLWFIGEILGGMVGLALFQDFWGAYIIGLLGAGLGAGSAFFAATRLPSRVTLPPPPEGMRRPQP